MKNLIILFSLCFLFLLGLSYYFGYSLNIVNFVEKNKDIKNGGVILYPFNEFNFNEGEWNMYVIVDIYDKKDFYFLSQYNRNIFVCSDKNVLQKIQKIPFIKQNGDMVTVQSLLLVENNKKLVGYFPIAINKNSEGIQMSNYGWLESEKKTLSFCLSKFKPTYYPVMIFQE